ncbi:MAG: hypothetical protein BWY33_02032 [Candidatus Dependentiae bacterium ADurb.Bin246]|nr:MAG: hypothetical protein BWY33_02032 [Candidatus Dependentiae bacterium ADurb.Bin246]
MIGTIGIEIYQKLFQEIIMIKRLIRLLKMMR